MQSLKRGLVAAALFFPVACTDHASQLAVATEAPPLATDTLFHALNAALHNQDQNLLYSKMASLGILANYDAMLAQANDASFVIGSLSFSNRRSSLVQARPMVAALDASFGTLGAYWTAIGFDPRTAALTNEDFFTYVQALADSPKSLALGAGLSRPISANQPIGPLPNPYSTQAYVPNTGVAAPNMLNPNCMAQHQIAWKKGINPYDLKDEINEEYQMESEIRQRQGELNRKTRGCLSSTYLITGFGRTDDTTLVTSDQITTLNGITNLNHTTEDPAFEPKD